MGDDEVGVLIEAYLKGRVKKMLATKLNPRTQVLVNHVNNDFNGIAVELSWTISLNEIHDNHSFIIFSVIRDNVSHKCGYLYSQSTDRSVYRFLEKDLDVIFIQGHDVEANNSFSQVCKIPVLPEKAFLYVLTDWNMEFLEVEPDVPDSMRKEKETISIIEENPLQQIYTHLQSLTSKIVERQAVLYHARFGYNQLTQDEVDSKAEGVSYLIQNAIDYYDNAETGNITQRMLNLYYGTIALMEAEMLIYGDRYKRLGEIENITKSGHGLLTFGEAKSLKDFHIGVLNKGLFQAWLSHRGIPVTEFPESRKKAEKSDFHVSLDDLLCNIPELQNVMQETEENYKPFFLFPCYDVSFNSRHFLQDIPYKRRYEGSYLAFLNLEGKHDPDWEKQLIESFLGSFTIVGEYNDRDSNGWRVFVRHQEGTNHYDSYNSHKGLSASMVLSPLFGRTDDWEVFAIMILYALSIIVRYMPNLWARILHGDLDNYKAVFYQFSRVAERELTQIFLEKLTGKNILITHPQGIL